MSGLKRAFSLTEMVVTAGLALLLSGLTLQLLSSFFRSSSQLSLSNQLQESVALALTRLGADARRSALNGLTIGSERLAFCGLDELDGRARQIWDKSATAYFRRGSNLVRQVQAESDWNGLRPMRLSSDQFQSIVDANRGASVCSSIATFEVSLQNDAALKVRLAVRQDDKGRTIQLESSRTFAVRNAP